jgi:hypothetical protein
MSSTNISLKINFQDEIRRILVPSNTDFQALVGKLKSMFNVSELKVQYKDSENDLITVRHRNSRPAYCGFVAL